MATREKASWLVATTATNGASAATRAAPGGGLRHYVTSVSGTYEVADTVGTLTLTDGTISVTWHVHNAFSLSFPSPIEFTPGDAVSLTLTASGAAGVDGTACLTGYTL